MLLKLIKKLFQAKEDTVEEVQEVKPKQKVRLKAGSEEWLARADDYTIQAYYSHLADKEKLAKAQKELDNAHASNERYCSFEMVPKKQGCRNVRSYLEYFTGSYKKWQFIRNNEEKKANYKCVICGYDSKDIKEDTSKTDCHEVWHYDIKTKVQKLVKLQSLCILCHKVKHIDQHSNNEVEFEDLLYLYGALNKISLEEARKDYDKHLAIRKTMDNTYFKYIDLSVLEKEYDINEDRFECHSPKFNEFIETKFKNKYDSE